MSIDLIGRVGVPRSAGVWPSAQACAPPQPTARPQQPVPPSAVALGERLHRAWAVGRFAAVANRDVPAAITELILHHVRVGFYGDRMDGMRRLTGFGPDGTLEVQLAPNRRNVPVVVKEARRDVCGLCEPPFPEERGLSWRNWRIWPNAFPYVPAEYEHIILTSGIHAQQQYSSAILGDMIDFQAFASDGRQLTMHYNGIAGNSQAHLHWQACRATTPLQRLIDNGRMQLTDVVRTATGRVSSFDQGSYCGILVDGDKSFVLRWADRLVAQLDRDATTRGAYNMVLLQSQNGRPRLVVFPRRADHLKPTAGDFRLGVGGFNTAGIVVVPRAELTKEFIDELGPAIRATQVPPGELPWLAELGKQSGATLPWAQALQPH